MRLLWVLAAVAAVVARTATGPHPIDDAYITFRYARNLAEGLGLVYNPGEWVLGTTAPLWAIILATGYRLGLTDLPWLATVISAACDAATAILLVCLARRMGWRWIGATLVGLAWALNPMSIGFATGGMETSLFVLLALGALTLAASDRAWIAAGICGLATLVRPEGALLAAVVVAWTFVSNRGQTLRAIVAAAVPIGLMGVVLSVRYGSPLPHSVAAKQVAYQPGWPFDNAAALLLQAGMPGWSTYVLAAAPAAVALSLAAFGLVTLVVLTRRGVLRLQAESVAWQPFAAFAAVYVLFYVVVGLRGVRLFPWYLVPIEPFYLLGAAAGLARIKTWQSSWVAAAALVVWQLPAVDWHQPLMPIGQDLAREQLYLAVGHELANSLPPGSVVAAPEIGALGYASNLPVLDTVGLISPAALPYYPLPADQLVTDNAIPARLIDDRRPDVVVTLDAFAARSLLTDPTFNADYALSSEYTANVWQSQKLLVFRRVNGG